MTMGTNVTPTAPSSAQLHVLTYDFSVPTRTFAYRKLKFLALPAIEVRIAHMNPALLVHHIAILPRTNAGCGMWSMWLGGLA